MAHEVEGTVTGKDETPRKKGTSPLKIIGILILVAVLLAVLGGAYLYFGLVKPLMGLEIQPGETKPISYNPLIFEGSLDIKNPGAKDVTLPGIDLDLYIEGDLIASGGLDKTVVPGGSSLSVTGQMVSSLRFSELLALLAGKSQVDMRIGGKIHSRPIAIPIPPIPIDSTGFLEGFNTNEGRILGALATAVNKNPDLTVGEALDSPEFIQAMEGQLGKDVSDKDIAQLKTLFEAQEIMDMKADDVLNVPGFMDMLQQ